MIGDMNRLPMSKRTAILGMLVEGTSLRTATPLADVSINTVSKMLVEVGAACEEYQNQTLRKLPCRRIQVDEIWAFCYAKEKNVPQDRKGQFRLRRRLDVGCD